MFWTAFVWGLGATFGGSIGLMAFVVMFAGWQWLANTKTAKRASEVAELSLKALDRRNDLTNEQINMLERVASAVEGLERSN